MATTVIANANHQKQHIIVNVLRQLVLHHGTTFRKEMGGEHGRDIIAIYVESSFQYVPNFKLVLSQYYNYYRVYIGMADAACTKSYSDRSMMNIKNSLDAISLAEFYRTLIRCRAGAKDQSVK